MKSKLKKVRAVEANACFSPFVKTNGNKSGEITEDILMQVTDATESIKVSKYHTLFTTLFLFI